MNSLYSLKGQLVSKKYSGHVGPRNIPMGKSIKISHLESILNELKAVRDEWLNDNRLEYKLVSIYYDRVISKSNRIKSLFHHGSVDNSDYVVGARFYNNNGNKSHLITYALKMEVIESGVNDYERMFLDAKRLYKDEITAKDLVNIKGKLSLSNSKFVGLIVDSYYINKIEIFENKDLIKESQNIVNLFNTFNDDYTVDKAINLLKSYGVEISKKAFIDDKTFVIDKVTLEILLTNAPYLVSMSLANLKEFTVDNSLALYKETRDIPNPKDEPIIGVIDSYYNTDVYYNDWVDSYNYDKNSEDYISDTHANKVISILVDGPNLNPALDDGCGRFRVKHFGVTAETKGYMAIIYKRIKEVVINNPEIKVWNLSLGSNREIGNNYISLIGALLDELQYERDITFVVAGTNKNENITTECKIGEPADSINSLVVNSVNFKNEPAKYTRVGNVLNFYNKPDIAYYGGDGNEIVVYSQNGKSFGSGTSFAAPWIARKMAYLICVMKLPREVAKALIIDSAVRWNNSLPDCKKIGYGIVPVKINDVINSSDDEIKFFISGKINEFETYTHSLPVPIYNEKYPYITKAILCYTPKCSRDQGVDYTLSEIDFQFGRIKNGSASTLDRINSIDNNHQSQLAFLNLPEEEARTAFRKWDNIKYLSDSNNKQNRARKIIGNGLWGVDLKVKERLQTKYGRNLSYGIVITLKEIEGVNRIEEFLKQCSLRGWNINKIDVTERVELFNDLQENVTFD